MIQQLSHTIELSLLKWMIKRLLSLLSAILISVGAWAFDFSSISPSGHTLYYNIINAHEVELTYPGNSSAYPYAGFTKPSGALFIPAKVSNNDATYAVTTLGHVALGYCNELTSITLPNTLILIGQHAFLGCSGLTALVVPPSVTTIGFQAFYGCTGIKKVSLPNSLTSVGDGAFTLCTGLDSISIPNSVTVIPLGAFASCSSLKKVGIPTSVTNIDQGAFSNCSGLTEITIPGSVATIGGSAFTGCSSLVSISLPNSVYSIGSWAFYMCTSLEDVTLPESLTNIEPSVFFECSSLKNVVIPHTVASIGDHAFRACRSLASITLGSGVRNISRTAFAECVGLKEIISEATVAPTLGEEAFKEVDVQIPIHIPCGSRLSYYARWAHFGNYVEDHTFALQASSSDSTQGGVEVLTQPTCVSPNAVVNAIPANGYQFEKWSNGALANPYLLTVTCDTTLTALFSLKAANVQYVHDTTFLYDTTYVDLWHYDTITLHDTIILAQESTYYNLAVNSANPLLGMVAGCGRFPKGTTVEIAAVPIQGNRFVGWDDGNMDNPRVVALDDELSLTASFASTQEVAEIADINFNITTSKGQIIVSDATHRRIRVFDNLGRLMATHTGGETVRVFKMPAAGVYLVQVGDYPAQKVVVVR